MRAKKQPQQTWDLSAAESAGVGRADAKTEKETVTVATSLVLGFDVGTRVGSGVGSGVGCGVGRGVGNAVGFGLGTAVGRAVGAGVGGGVGKGDVGTGVGGSAGRGVGAGVGGGDGGGVGGGVGRRLGRGEGGRDGPCVLLVAATNARGWNAAPPSPSAATQAAARRVQWKLNSRSGLVAPLASYVATVTTTPTGPLSGEKASTSNRPGVPGTGTAST